jgi:hypothetical protein
VITGRRGQPAGREHTLGTVSAAMAEPPAGDATQVRVSESVLRRLDELPRAEAAAVARVILNVPFPDAEPAEFDVPGDPPDTIYWAARPSALSAPVVIYRRALPGEQGKWLVAALIRPDAYRTYSLRPAADPLVKDVAAIVAAGTISASSAVMRPLGPITQGESKPSE